MKNCKPCLTIRAFFYLLFLHFGRFVRDVRSYSQVNQMACLISESKPLTKLKPNPDLVKIREMAEAKFTGPIDVKTLQ